MENGAGVFYELPHRAGCVLVLRATQFADYSVRMAENVAALAKHEDRDPNHVLQDLLASNDDVVRIGIDTPAQDGSLSLVEGSSLYNESRMLLLAAARATERPAHAFINRPTKRVQDYLRSVRFGRPESGSLVLPIYSPVPAEEQGETSDEETAPMARQAVKTLLSALQAAKDQISHFEAQNSVARLEEEINKGMSSNLCDALLSLMELGRSVSLSIRWALAHPSPESDYQVRFEQSDVPRLEQTKRALEMDGQSVQISGHVSGLVRTPERNEGTAKVRAKVGDVHRTVHLHHIPDSNYSRLVEAHKHRHRIELSGRLQRRGHTWELDRLTGLRFLVND